MGQLVEGNRPECRRRIRTSLYVQSIGYSMREKRSLFIHRNHNPELEMKSAVSVCVCVCLCVGQII